MQMQKALMGYGIYDIHQTIQNNNNRHCALVRVNIRFFCFPAMVMAVCAGLHVWICAVKAHKTHHAISCTALYTKMRGYHRDYTAA